jgi:hypothetical protein
MIDKAKFHLNLYKVENSQRAPPMPKEDSTERVKIVPYDDGWPGFEEKIMEV